MKTLFDESFWKSIRKIKDRKVKLKVASLISEFENAKTLFDVLNVKKLKGYSSFYRVRVGDFRIGFELIDSETVLFIIVAQRKEIYRIFP